MASCQDLFDELARAVLEACQAHDDERLMSFVLYGSAARGVPRADSDLDFLIVADPLPRGRWARIRDFSAMERERLATVLATARQRGLHVDLSPMIKTPAEAEYGSPVFLDMVEDGRILFDRGELMTRRLERLRRRLTELGARRI